MRLSVLDSVVCIFTVSYSQIMIVVVLLNRWITWIACTLGSIGIVFCFFPSHISQIALGLSSVVSQIVFSQIWFWQFLEPIGLVRVVCSWIM